MRFEAAASTAIDSLLAAPARDAAVLGVTDAAVFLAVRASAAHRRDVVAVLTSDAVRLPCAVVLPSTSAQRPLTRFAPRPNDRAVVGDGCLRWPSRTGPVVIHTVRRWPPATIEAAAAGWEAGLGVLRAKTADIDIGLPPALLASRHADRVLGLLGRGPGLTPSGDDVLAGLLLGARAFATPVDGLAEAIDAHADSRTTTLSAQLLRHALRGECVPELRELIAALPDPYRVDASLEALLRVGHTSGAALARGVLMATGGTERNDWIALRD